MINSSFLLRSIRMAMRENKHTLMLRLQRLCYKAIGTGGATLLHFLFSFVVIIGLSGGNAIAQIKPSDVSGKATIAGTVVDSLTKKPVGYATITLRQESAQKVVNGAISDDKGKFVIDNVEPGQYVLSVSFIGYKDKTRSVIISAKNPDVNVGDLFVREKSVSLAEVEIIGQKDIFEDRVDRTVYHAERDATSAGGDAAEVLRRVPAVTVDFNGGISLRGNSNVTLLINGKPSTVFAGSVGDALKLIPANEVKSVEVITAPSAKYDGDGSGGIVNIVTRKNRIEGFTLGVDVAAGFRASSLGLTGNYRTKKVGFTLGGWGRTNYNIKGHFENDQTTNGLDTTRQFTSTRNDGVLGNYNFGFDADLNAKNIITGSVRFGILNNNVYQDGLTTEVYRQSSLGMATRQNAFVSDLSNNVAMDVTYTRYFTKPQHELSVQALYTRNGRNNDFKNQILQRSDLYSGPDRIRNFNRSRNNEFTVQIDYQAPVTSSSMFEVGIKNISREAVSDYAFAEAYGSGEFEIAPEGPRNNQLDYDQEVGAAYSTFMHSLRSGYVVKAGVRYEYARILGRSRTGEDLNIPDYGALLPGIHVSRRMKNDATVKISYNRRIQRPSILYLNPNVQAANPVHITRGNPNLDPEFADNIELGYSTFIKATSITMNIFTRSIHDAIQRVSTVGGATRPGQPDTIATTFANIGSERAFGLSVFGSVNVGRFSLNGGGEGYYVELESDPGNGTSEDRNAGWVFKGRFFSNYKLNDGWSVMLLALFNGRTILLQGYRDEFRIYTLLIRKEFKNKRGTIGLGAENFFSPTLNLRGETRSASFSQRNLSSLNNFNLRLNFSYRIGKPANGSEKRVRRRQITNDDLKEGGSGIGNDGPGLPTPPGGGTPGPAPAEKKKN